MPLQDEISHENYAYRSYIKDIYIELPDYKYHHHPIDGKNDSKDNKEVFVGREGIAEKFLSILLNGAPNGAYLVTGYRGMGKTSFVKRVLANYKEKAQDKNEEVIQLNISFSQSELKDTDILRQITKKLIDQAEENIAVRIADTFSLSNILRFTFWILFLIFIVLTFKNYESISYKNSKQDDSLKQSFFSDTLIELRKKNNKGEITKYFEYRITKEESKKESLKKNTQWLKNVEPFSKDISKIFLEGEVTKVLGVVLIFAFLALLIAYSFYFILRLLISISYHNYENIFYKIFVNIFKNFIYFLILYIAQFYLTLYLFFIKVSFPNICFLTLTTLAIMLFLKFFTEAKERTIGERIIHKQLINLYERCNASITNESGIQSANEHIPLGFIQRKVKQYAIASAKEIEYELIDILKKYNNFKSYKKRFIIVFDELDKVEPSLGKGYYFDDSKTLEQYEFTQVQLNELRERKKAIINILSSLKYFVTEAHARFIFIAGREMFDASLADIADRQSFISSIFHQIIYVDSFLKDGSTSKDVTPEAKKLTDIVEQYLEFILLGKVNTQNISLLKEYYKHINNLNSYYKPQLSKGELLKIVFTLQNFIIFLSYRSNGSPKKLVKLIEDHIVSKENFNPSKNTTILIQKDTNKTKVKSYLKFDYNQQYRFAFITHLFRPFLMDSGNVIKKYSDNVLVSTPYLMDHIIKFHPFAFSIQNLELLPEVISSNRNPIVRHFIEEIINFLRQSHIRETELSIFDFKFYNKTANELAYLSKIFEEESAAFNFSLDEMYYIKLYLKNKIRELRKNYSEFISGDTSHPVYSISFLNNLLGDSHYFDQEFDNAIVAYLDGLQALRSVSVEYQTSEWFVSSMKFKLKIGLIYERIKTSDLAITYYNDAINDAQKYFSKPPKEEVSFLLLNETTKQNSTSTPRGYLLQLTYQAYAASAYLQEKVDVSGISIERINYQTKQVEKLHKNLLLSKHLNPLPLADFYNDLGTLLYYKNFTKDSFHTIPLVCELKSNKSLLNHLFTEPLDPNCKPEPTLENNKDFRYPYESLIYYKKSLQELLNKKGENITLFDLCQEASKIILNDYKNIHSSNHLKIIGFTLSNIGDILYSVYLPSKSLSRILLNPTCVWREKTSIDAMIEDNIKKSPSFVPSIIRNRWFISKEGDLLSLKIEALNKKNSSKDLNDLYEQIKGPYRRMSFWDQTCYNFFINDFEEANNQKDELEIIIFIYYLSGRFYSKAGRSVSFSFNLRKILQIIRCSIKEVSNKSNLIYFLEETILHLILEISSWNSSSTDRPQMYKFKYYENLDGEHPPFNRRHNYSHISNSPDTREAILIFADLKFRLNGLPKKISMKKLNEINELSLIHSETTIFSQHTRLQQLDLQDKINRVIMQKIFPEWKPWEENYTILNSASKDYIEDKEKYFEATGMGTSSSEIKNMYIQLTASSISCLFQAIQIIKIFNPNPYLSCSLLANFHRRLGRWYKHYYLCKMLFSASDKSEKPHNIDTILETILGKEVMVTIDNASQFQHAIQLFHKAKEMHSNGGSYHTQISNYLYLEGDYDDNLYHFGIALERQQINSGNIRKKIKELEKELGTSPLYKYDSFANFNSPKNA